MAFFNGYLNQHYIQHHLSPFLTPSEALQTRLVSKDFAKALGDKVVWIEYYKERGLDASKTSQQTTGNHNLSNLARTFKIWTSIHEEINASIKDATRSRYYILKLRNRCIAVIALPELAPLHSFVMLTLDQHCNLKELSRDELLLGVVIKDKRFKVSYATRELAIHSQSHRATDPQVQQALINIVTEPSIDKKSLLSAAVQYIDSGQIEEVLLNSLKRHSPYLLLPAIKNHLPNPRILQKFINWGTAGLAQVVAPHLNNQSVVDQLLEQFSETKKNDALMRALMPLLYQAQVQRAFCRKVEELTPDIEYWRDTVENLVKSLQNTSLHEEIQNEFQNSTDDLKQLIHQAVRKSDPKKQRQELITALSNDDPFIRKVAAEALVPIASDDPEILEAFYKRVAEKDFQEVATIVIPALAKLVHQKEVRTTLIQVLRACNPPLTVATINVLQPYIDEPEVRDAFLEQFDDPECCSVGCHLTNILAPQLDREDVLSLFLKATTRPQLSFQLSEWQIAVIRKLTPFLNRAEVKDTLLEVLDHCSYEVRAVLLQSLCSDSSKPLLKTKAIFRECMHEDSDVRSAALHVLKQWITPNTSNEELA